MHNVSLTLGEAVTRLSAASYRLSAAFLRNCRLHDEADRQDTKAVLLDLQADALREQINDDSGPCR